ncbi:MAG: AarF/UbiB family protein [Planctomycetes bacterium]|nr:AarF/UbiB family protein [Planctomycetota bacterium]
MLRSIRTIRNIRRLKDITLILGKHGLYQLASLLGAPFRWQLRRFFPSPGAPLTQAARLRLAFEQLGPTFIKLGQFIANRPDLFSKELVQEFSRLEDRVDPLPFAALRATLEAELGADWVRHFAHVDEKPIASASLAQIHRARTRAGDEVVLKIQKPDTARIIERDLEILMLVAEALSHLEDFAILDPARIVGEVRRAVARELNFHFERNAQERVRASFRDDSVLVVPRTFPELSTRRVLVMEYLQGTPLRQCRLAREEAELVARNCSRILFSMIFRDGYFHADPHASNILVLDGGKLGWVDFGAMGLLTEETRAHLVHLLKALVERNYREVARRVLRVARVKGEISLGEFAQDLASRLDPFFGLKVEEVDVAALFSAILELSREHKITINPSLVLMTRCLLLIEGVAHQLAPGFNVMVEVEPLVREFVRSTYRPERLLGKAGDRLLELAETVFEYPQHVGDILRKMGQGRFQVDTQLQGLDRLTRRVEMSANHVVQALIVSALLVSSSLVMSLGVGPAVWGISAIGLGGYVAAALLGVWAVFAILRHK